MTRININDIPRDHKYEGYLWMSDAVDPIVLNGEPLPSDFNQTVNPFVVEAELWDGKTSYAIHQAGNQTIVESYEVNEADFSSEDTDRTVYASNRMEGKNLHFLEYWEEKEADACLGMPALTMTKRVFVGFKDKEDKA